VRLPEMSILSGKSTGHRPVMDVENMNLRNNGEKPFKTTNREFKIDSRIFNP